ncbi:MAG: Asp-tRNA(Asn)/Glu-tRNA(Gln) amidotransferase subunit GatC [Bacteroidia bacterium]|nr:Asp-tRNA(Asn)/Glu-tRNA(Gln) amidotransferase subunit GatC [Bacteroidia bacterium]MDW8158769.1 Asp-tRNA(Asn)/Glu-tRNA(Gln) amidotransferase subunit GatC [Bacteroidia bacterium]
MEINDELIDKLCTLARLEFAGEEREEIKKDLQKILEFVSLINEVDTQGVEPLIHITAGSNHFREDTPLLLITREEALQNAPAKDSEYFHVPKFVDKTEN